jgi:hypothetical protein
MNNNNSTKNKTLYIIIGIVVVVVLLKVIGGVIGGGVERAVTGGTVQRDLRGATTYSNENGSVTVGGTSYPDNWPSDAPKYSGGNIQYAGATNPQNGSAGASVVFTTKDTVSAVTAFYKKELPASGWTIEQTMNTGGATVMSAKKDTRTFGMYIVESEGTVTVTIGIELGK